MQIIKLGSKGPDVERWQNFLIGFYLDVRGQLDADGIFGSITQDTTIRFQKQFGLLADGVVGNKTVGTAMTHGFPVVDAPEDDKSGPSWPPPPAGYAPITSADRDRLFGKFEFDAAPVPGNPEAIRILGSWVNDNIISVSVPQFSRVSGSPKSGTCQINKHCSAQFLNLWAAWDKAGLLDRIGSWNGSFVPRFIRGSTVNLSNHSLGTAFDINAPWNPLGTQPALLGKQGCNRELVLIAYDHGFSWGGWYRNTLDGMHFECYKTL